MRRRAGVTVLAYRDAPTGTMVEDGAKGGHFSKVVLRPSVRIARGADAARARALHESAHQKCFIANSVNFPVTCEPEITDSE